MVSPGSILKLTVASATVGITLFLTPPSIMVGAVVVKNGKLAGGGFHEIVGGPHAEDIGVGHRLGAHAGHD